MKKTIKIITPILMFLIYAASAFCAPAGNIGDPVVWKKGLFFEDWNSSIFLAAEWDRQRNTLPNQQRMPMWNDPRTPVDEVRHYEQYRRSDNELICSNFKLGAVIERLWTVYFLFGICDSTIDLTYFDKTVEPGYSVDTTFQSDGDLFYGAGLSFIMHEGYIRDILPIKVGLDIKYRRFDFEVDNIYKNGTYYTATLDEIQMALLLSADAGFLHPYIGARVSSTTGKEQYINQKVSAPFYDDGYINYEDDITWSKNLGYVIGAAYAIKEAVSINVELRFGDEEAVGCSASMRF